MPHLGGEVRSRSARQPASRRVPLASALLSLLPALGGLPVTAQVTVVDVGLQSGLQDLFFDTFKRGRALVAADFDLDGRTDFFVGNPSDESFILIDRESEGPPAYELAHLIDDSLIAWGAAAADYDNDGDTDLFIAVGGNECTGFDRLYKNLFVETGEVDFENVTEEAGVSGPLFPGTDVRVPMASANGVWGDYDRDGDVDLFVNSNNEVACGPLAKVMGTNVLWRNNGDGTFRNVTVEAGLNLTQRPTRHSSFLDIDNDGFYDLYENNYTDGNVLWHNQGDGTFVDATAEFSLPGEDLTFPGNSFVSCPGDFDNNGWMDLMVFARDDVDEVSDCSALHDADRGFGPDVNLAESPYELGHALFINQEGLGFGNRAIEAGLNAPYIAFRGVMGSQIGDLNADGTLDIFVGNGGPIAGERNQLLLSDPRAEVPPSYQDASFLIDFPAPEDANAPPGTYPEYPYRAHGATILDLDLDGTQELVVSNGGPSDASDIPPIAQVAEPNRAFRFDWGPDRDIRYLQVRLQGDGENVSRDAIGSRVEVVVSEGGGERRSVHRTLFGGSCFSAQNGFVLYFGLGQADTVHEVRVVWVDGSTTVITEGLEINSQLPIQYGS